MKSTIIFLLLNVGFASIHLREIVFPSGTTVIVHTEEGKEQQVPWNACIFNRIDDPLQHPGTVVFKTFRFQNDFDQGYWCYRNNPNIGGLFSQDRYGGIVGQVDAFTIPKFEKIPAIIKYEMKVLQFAGYRNREIYYLKCSHTFCIDDIDNMKLLRQLVDWGYANNLENLVKYFRLLKVPKKSAVNQLLNKWAQIKKNPDQVEFRRLWNNSDNLVQVPKMLRVNQFLKKWVQVKNIAKLSVKKYKETQPQKQMQCLETVLDVRVSLLSLLLLLLLVVPHASYISLFRST